MQPKHNKKLIIKVLVVGAIIAILSYLFHPGVGQLSVMLNGEPVAEPLVRFAAIPTFLLIMMIPAYWWRYYSRAIYLPMHSSP